MAFINDQYYINQIIGGNPNAFAALVDQYKDMVFTLANKMLRNREEAEEIAQDVFIKVFRSLDKFKGESKFSTWMYKITYNACLDRLKKSKNNTHVTYIEDFSAHQIKAIENVLESIDLRERNQIIQDCLELLSSEDAAILTLYYFDDQNMEEIAKVTGSNANAVKVKLFRSRKKLASLLKLRLKPEYYGNERR